MVFLKLLVFTKILDMSDVMRTLIAIAYLSPTQFVSYSPSPLLAGLLNILWRSQIVGLMFKLISLTFELSAINADSLPILSYQTHSQYKPHSHSVDFVWVSVDIGLFDILP